jgi:hypothetical protein
MCRVTVLAIAAILLTAGSANAGIYTDEMSKCLVARSSDADKELLVQWMFALMSTNPSVAAMSKVTAADRDSYDRRAAGVFQRLLLQDCRKETVAAIKYEGTGAIRSSFSVLGQVAMANLMGNPATVQELAGFAKYADASKFAELANEAGQVTPTPAH